MAQKNRKVVKDVPGTVKEFSSITFKKFKKENNHHLILAVAICYDSKMKEHYCKIEELR